MRLKNSVIIVSLLASITLITVGCGSKKDTWIEKQINYPTKTIRLINYGDVGSGPDTVNRKVAEVLQKKFGWNFEVINVTGNLGSDAVKKVWEAPHDGYTILGQSENVLSFPVLGLTSQTSKSWTYFEVLQDSTVLVVNPKASYKNIESFVNAAKVKPESIKIANGGEGKSFHLKAKILEKVAGVQIQHKFYKGGNKAIEAVLNGEADAASVSVSQAKKAIADGKLRPLVILDLGAYDFGGNISKVESITKYYPDAKKYLPLDAVIGLAMPSDVPKVVIDKFGKAFDEVMSSSEMDVLSTKRDNIKVGFWGENARKYIAEMESTYSWILKELGLAKVDPETLGIPKPQ